MQARIRPCPFDHFSESRVIFPSLLILICWVSPALIRCLGQFTNALIHSGLSACWVLSARILDYGNSEYTSIARTVALPTAIAVMLILEGKITNTGVHIPIIKAIYKPVLAALSNLGISMSESIERV